MTIEAPTMGRSNRSEVPKPTNFALIIGAMKSGTTSLFHVLSQHPEIAAAAVKEPKFFSNDDVWMKGWDWYAGLWNWDADCHRIALEASPAYTTYPSRPGVPERIAGIPGARFRFVYIMRHPVRQIESHIRHTLYLGWGRPLDEGIPSWMVDTARYAMQIDQYVARFPRESLLLLTLEEFERQPNEVLRRACEFLGVSEGFAFTGADERYNAGAAYEIPSWLARILKQGRAARWLLARTPRHIRYRIRSLLPRIARRKGSLGRHTLNEEESRVLMAELAADLRRLEEVYGIDVGRWWSIDAATLPS